MIIIILPANHLTIHNHLIVINIFLCLTSNIQQFIPQTMADVDAKSMNDLFKLVEKLTIQLNEKDKELATNKQQNMVYHLS
jgi:hypothetical protein